MSTNQARFVWYEVMTSDTKAAEAFYASVVGWKMQDAGMGGPPYTILSAGDIMVGGIMEVPEEARAMGGKTLLDGLCRGQRRR